MRKEFLLPDLGEGLTDAEVVRWLVQPGDVVGLNQAIAEVETAKAVVELPSPFEGAVSALHAEPGETVAVGAPLITFEVDAEADAPDAPDAPSKAESDAQPNLVGYGAPSSGRRPTRKRRRAAVVDQHHGSTAVMEAAPHDAHPAPHADEPRHERPRSTPPVRKYAKDHGVDIALIAAVVGERPVTREDVDEYVRASGGVTGVGPLAVTTPDLLAAPRSAARRETRVPIRGLRKRTAEAMVASAFTAPHVTTFHTVDVTATMELLAAFREDAALAGHRIGILAVVSKAVCLTLSQMPELNARWDEAAQEIVHQHFVDLGIAAATDRGLIVPVIRDAHAHTLVELADSLAALTETARAGKTAPADLVGGTFSITNIGVFGVDAGTPILPPGQTGILAVGAVARKPWAHNGEVALRDVLTLSLSFDHRVVDGAEGARFLKSIADLLEQPGRSMLMR